MNIQKNIYYFFLILFLIKFTKSGYCTYASFVDFKFILNESDAGKKAQAFIKKELNTGLKKI